MCLYLKVSTFLRWEGFGLFGSVKFGPNDVGVKAPLKTTHWKVWLISWVNTTRADLGTVAALPQYPPPCVPTLQGMGGSVPKTFGAFIFQPFSRTFMSQLCFKPSSSPP